MMRRLAALLIACAAPWLAAAPAAAGPCDEGVEAWGAAAQANVLSLYEMEWAPFGRTEWGWGTYLPLIRREIASACGPAQPGFARALAAFQSRYGLAPNGVFDAATFQVFRGVWQERRPFVMLRVAGECPEPPSVSLLAYIPVEEEHADRLTRMARRDVLEAYRDMAAAARAEAPEIAADPELLQIFSAYREPEDDAARCAADGNCDGVRRAACSPHRTGAALDLYVGHMPGRGVDDTAADSRRHMSRGAAYRWLVDNAHRFGFVPYVFEPWHWEWVGRP